MASVDLNSQKWVDLVFEGKNKDFGAYKMRTGSTRRHNIALIAVLALVALVVIGLFVGRAYSKYRLEQALKEATAMVEQQTVDTPTEEEVEEEEEEQIDIPEPEPEEVMEKEEVANSIQNTAIEIVDDDKAVNEVKSQEDLQQDDRVVASVDVIDGVDDATKTVVTKEVVVVEEKPKEEVTYDLANVQQKPEFPGGEKAMYEFMNKNIHYPPVAQEEGIQGTVVVQFTIAKDGSVTGAKAVRSPHESLSNEAVRMVMSMPKWTPGRNNGQAVKVNYTLPVRFKLSK